VPVDPVRMPPFRRRCGAARACSSGPRDRASDTVLPGACAIRYRARGMPASRPATEPRQQGHRAHVGRAHRPRRSAPRVLGSAGVTGCGAVPLKPRGRSGRRDARPGPASRPPRVWPRGQELPQFWPGGTRPAAEAKHSAAEGAPGCRDAALTAWLELWVDFLRSTGAIPRTSRIHQVDAAPHGCVLLPFVILTSKIRCKYAAA
jgi:hypothetical protein